MYMYQVMVLRTITEFAALYFMSRHSDHAISYHVTLRIPCYITTCDTISRYIIMM